MRIFEALLRKTVGRHSPGSYPLYLLARRVIESYENRNVNIDLNGERWFQHRLAAHGIAHAFDVGANRGEWAEGILAAAPDARITCYEPVPATFALLHSNVTSDRAELINAALSDSAGKLAIQSVIGRPELSSMHADYSAHKDVETVEIETRTCDEELARLGIDHLEVLKVDAEGHDLAVLKGAHQALVAGRIDFIQFEYNFATLAAQRSLKAFFDLLSEHYLMCRLLPNGLEAMAYHASLDHFGQSNWICVRRSLVDPALARHFNISRAKGLAGDLLARELQGDPRLSFLAG